MRFKNNSYRGEGANGGCFFEIEESDKKDKVWLKVGWSCVVVHDDMDRYGKPIEVPVTWLSELIAIATAHKDGISGFLKEHNYGDPSYALMCDPSEGLTK